MLESLRLSSEGSANVFPGIVRLAKSFPIKLLTRSVYNKQIEDITQHLG